MITALCREPTLLGAQATRVAEFASAGLWAMPGGFPTEAGFEGSIERSGLQSFRATGIPSKQLYLMPRCGLSSASISASITFCRPTIKYNRSEEHTSQLHSLMRISYAVFFLKKK